MTQAALAPLNPATTSGTDLADKLVDFEQAVLTQHSGVSAPSYIQAGTIWLDTTTDPYLWKFYDGVSDIILAKFDITSHRRQSPVDEATIASAATTNVLGSASEFVAISGTATITSLGSEPNQIKYVRATGAFILTHHATTLILPTGANITAASGDTFIVVSDSSGNARVFAYARATGSALTVPSAEIPTGTIMLFFGSASAPTGWTKDTTNFNDHAIRIVTGTPSSGGSLNFSSVFARTATDGFVLLEADLPIHDHSIAQHTHGAGTYALASSGINNGSGVTRNYDRVVTSRQAGGGSSFNFVQSADWDENTLTLASTDVTGTSSTGGPTLTGTAGSNSSHAHNMDIRVRYVDAIRCTKN